jgi:hypothetical protein
MKIGKIFLAIGLIIAIVGFLIGAFYGNRELGKSLFLTGFLFVVIGIVSLVYIVQPTGSRGTGMRVAAGGFLVVALGALVNFAATSIKTLGNIAFDFGVVIMIGGIILHLITLVRSKRNPD